MGLMAGSSAMDLSLVSSHKPWFKAMANSCVHNTLQTNHSGVWESLVCVFYYFRP
jgi:hypothetical protein